MPQKSAMVIWRRSNHLTSISFIGKIDYWVYMYFVVILLLVHDLSLIELAEEGDCL